MLNQWLKIGELVSFKNRDMGKILFCVLASQIFKDIKVEYFGGPRSIRLSAFIISPTRSGKGQYTSLLKTTGERCGLSVAIETKVTDAGLIGTLDGEAIKYNTKHGYSEGMHQYQNPVIYGDLYDKDIIIWNEAKTMLKQTNYNQDTLEILQEATDNTGHLRKKLSALHEIKFNTSTSIIATTYYLKQLNTVLLEQGIFQRLLVLVQRKTFQDRADLNAVIIGNLKKNTSIEQEIDSFCSQLLELKEKRKKKVYKLDLLATEAIEKYIKEYENIIMKQFNGQLLDLLAPFTTSAIELLVKISTILSIVDENNDKPLVSYRHVAQANGILVLCMRSILKELSTQISTSNENTDLEKYIIQYLTQHPKINKEKLYKGINKKYGFHRNKIISTTRQMIANYTIKMDKVKTGKATRPLEVLYIEK